MFDVLLNTGTTCRCTQTTHLTLQELSIYTGSLKNKQMRIGEHLDYGTITLLWQINDVPPD